MERRLLIRTAAIVGWVTAALVLAKMSASSYGAGLLVADGGLGGVLEIKEHDVNVTINNGIAVTQVTQVFHNTENRQVEALYTFPVPEGASVSNFSMWIKGKEMIGEVLEKQRAREIYNSYKQVRRDPGLLEQTNFKTFEMRVFPIEPNADQKVEVTYYQELDYDHDWATYVYPLATTTRTGLDARTTGRMALNLNVKSEVPIATLESPSHKDGFAIVRHDDNYYQASLETRGGDLNRDLVVACQLSRPHTGLDLITSREKGDDGYFCLTLTAGKELETTRTGMDYVFIMDISGSMADGGKLNLSRGQVSAFVKTLAADDRFEIVTFNVSPKPLFGSLKPADDEAKGEAERFLTEQRAVGGTVLKPALTAAYRYVDADRPLNVVILSDGMTDQVESKTLFELIRSRPPRARVFCVGVGNEINRPLLQQVADDAGGLAAFLSPEDNFERQAEAFRRKLTRPVATGLKMSFDGGDVYDIEPPVLPNLYHGSPVRLYGRFRGTGEVQATLRAEVDGAPLEIPVPMNLPEVDAENPQIERMWAWHRVQRLLNEGDRAGSRTDVLGEVIKLGETYSIATEYTSFIVLENDAEYQRWRIERRNLQRTARDREPQRQLQARLESIRNKAVNGLGPEAVSALPAEPPASPSVVNTVTSATPRTQSPASPATPRSNLGWNVNLRPKGGSGSGAIDPLTGLVAVSIGGLAWLSRRKKQQ